MFIRNTLYIDCDKRYCLDTTLDKHDTGHKRYTRCYHLPCAVISTAKARVIDGGRLLSLGSVGHSSRLRTLLSTNISSLGVRKQLGSTNCIGGVATCCQGGLSTILSHHPRCHHTSTNQDACAFRPMTRGDFGHKFAAFLLRKQATSVATFGAPGSLNRPIKVIGRVGNGSFAITNLGRLGGKSKLIFFGEGNRLRNFHIGQIRTGQIFPLSVPRLAPGAPLCHGFSRTFSGLLTGPSTRHGLSIRVRFLSGPFNFALYVRSRAKTQVVLARPFTGRLTHHRRRSGVQARLSGLKGAPFRTSGIIINLSRG